jgi:hypothetical protein
MLQLFIEIVNDELLYKRIYNNTKQNVDIQLNVNITVIPKPNFI